MSARALIVASDGHAYVSSIATDLRTLQQLVGGWLESVTVDDWHAYVDEEGKLKGSPVNRAADALAFVLGWRTGDLLCGPAVFLGHDDEGEEDDVPERVIDAARSLGILS